MHSANSILSRKSAYGALVGSMLGLAALTGCSSSDFPVIANVTVEPDGWSASTESVAITLTADVTGVDNPVSSVTAEGMDMSFTLSKADDLATGGEHWTVTKTVSGPFTAGTYELIFTATDSEGDVATSASGGATVTITAD